MGGRAMLSIKHSEILGGLAASIDLEGPLNNKTAGDLVDYIEGLLGGGIVFIIINAAGIKNISSGGIGVIIRAQRLVTEKRGFLALYAIPPEIISMFRILGFDKLIRIAGGRIEAMEIIDEQIEMRGINRGSSADNIPHESAGAAVNEFQPIVIECEKCASLVRVKGPGQFKCPECEAEFTVTLDHIVKF